MIYTNEHDILLDLKKCFNDNLKDMDINMYEVIDKYVENPHNINDKEFSLIEEFINENKEEEISFDIKTLSSDKKELASKFNYIKPFKLNMPTAPIKRMLMQGKNFTKTVIPIYTDAKKLELKLSA